MGRNKTGAATCKEVQRIELSHLIKRKLIQKGKQISFPYSWSDGWGNPLGNVWMTTNYGAEEKYLKLKYTITDRYSGDKTHYDYKIQLTAIPSNLGKGEVLYFLCPVSGKRCRILYSAYRYPKWKSREAYQNRLYYDGQLSSKLDKANDTYWALNRQLEKMEAAKHYPLSYNGIPTKRQQRMERLTDKMDYWDYERWQPNSFPAYFRNHLERKLLKDWENGFDVNP